MARRLTRKQIKHDEFVTIVDRAAHWIGGNWRQAAIALGGAVALGLIWWGVTAGLAARSGSASLKLAVAIQTYEAPVGEDAAPDAKLKFDSRSAKLDAAEQAFRPIASRYWRTPQSRMAKLYLARIASDRGDQAQSLRLLGELTSRSSDEPVVRLAMLDLIRMRTAKGEGQQLVRDLEAMVAGKDARLPRDVALFQLAKIWEHEGKAEEADKLYRKLIEDFSDSPYARDARQQLAAVN